MKRQPSNLKVHNINPPDDLPVALRSHSFAAGTKERSPLPTFLAISTGLLFTAGLTLIVILTFRELFPSLPVPGLRARLSADGRLLGHFPYPEARLHTLVEASPGFLLHPSAAKSFHEMKQEAAADGINLKLLSAFRPIEVQRQLFFDVKADRNQPAIERAKVSAPPGFSEHSTGYALDLGDESQENTNLSANFVHTRAYQWLSSHAARFQFVLSFPRNNPQGVSFEPWHWRYEGTTDALKVFEPAHRLVQTNGRLEQRTSP